MSKRSHFERIGQLLDDVRNAIQAHHNLVNSKIQKYNLQVESDRERLNTETLAFEIRKNKELLQGDVRFSADQAVQNVTLAFDDIISEINDWSIEVPSSDFLTLAQTVDRFDLPLTIDEIKMLSQSAAGSYFGQKILNGYAMKSGLQYPFMTIDALLQMIRNAKNDCILSIQAYSGDYPQLADYGWITEESGKYESFRRLFASEYLDKTDSSLMRLKESLTFATDSTISLIPNEQERLASMFEDTLPENRIDRMKTLIVERPKLERKLAVFDPECYKQAKKDIREQKMQEQYNAMQAVKEASRKAMQVRADALKASL